MNSLMPQLSLPVQSLDLRLAFLSTYPPRRCGIGTYTKDLATAINNLNPECLAEIIAMDDAISEGLDYPWEVSHRIRQNEWADYERVLDYLNNSVIDIIAIQHEFGIFGGPDGEYVVEFAKRLKKPFIVTLHTVLERPSPNQRRIIQELARRSSAVVVMLSVASDILRTVYGVPREKVVAIHHGAPDLPFLDDGGTKKQLGLENKIVMSSINLLSPGKGLEYAIEALPEVVAKYPNFLYLIIGETHPVVRKEKGERYREHLKKLVAKHHLTRHVKFVNAYIPLNKLIEYIRASDLYITPYTNMEQISSGALAYAVAAGKLCVSTPYRYAKEMLVGRRGYLVAAENPLAIRDAILHGLNNPEAAYRMRQKCYAQGRMMTWARVGFRYVRMIDHLLIAYSRPLKYISVSLDHLKSMTNHNGLVEHATRYQPNMGEGYATDDNARALMVAIQHGERELAQLYLDFLVSAESGGKLYCDADRKMRWHGEPGIGDWFGRTVWAAAYAIQYGPTLKIRNKASQLLQQLIPTCREVTHLRTLAYILLGLACLQEVEWDKFRQERARLARKAIATIKEEFIRHADANWRWPEPVLSYDNTRIPQALLAVGRAWGDQKLIDLGIEMLDFLIDQTYDVLGNHFRFVGNKGWYPKAGEKALFDEQPIEAGATVQACYMAYVTTGIGHYRDLANKAFSWYHGDNSLRRPLYDAKRGAVHDGLGENATNLNHGAEATVEYLLSATCYSKIIEEGIEPSDRTYPLAPKRAIVEAPRFTLGEKRRS